ncbi:MAG: DUF481 domain-containing protein [Planctomycetota bacterium]|nr:DUF481 domain-containing protein [Planctomycetota bacterium]
MKWYAAILIAGAIALWSVSAVHAQEGPALQSELITPLPPISEESEAVDTPAPDSKSTEKADAGAGILLEPGEKLVIPEDEIIAAPPKIWEGTIDFGANGTEGVSQTFNLRSGIKAKRTTDATRFTASLDYVNDTNYSEEIANRAFLEARNEWLFKDSRWTYYIHETTEYDEFQPYKMRVMVDLGIGYQFIKNETTSLIGRTGPGVSREIDGPNDDYLPELNFGLAFEHRFSERQKVTLEVDHIPTVDDFTQYRINTRANWEMLVDAERNISLKVGIINRYDSTPEGAPYNNLDYKTMVVWAF